MKRGTIYLILNKQTEQKYIGHTELSLNKEWAQHIDKSKRMSSELIHRAFRTHGIHNFMIRELDEYDETTLDVKLEKWFRQYQPDYNPKRIIIEEEDDEEIIQPIIKPVHGNKGKGNIGNLIPFNKNTRTDGKHSGLKIRGRNMTTGKVYDWNSAREAALEITGDAKRNSNILNAAKKGFKYYGYRWMIMENKTKKKAVFAVNKKTDMIEIRFESIAATLRYYQATSSTGLRRSLKNPGRFGWKGCYWFYA